MIPINFPGVNFTIRNPNQRDLPTSIPVFSGFSPAIKPCIISCWRFSEEDIENIQKTGIIWIEIMGYHLSPHTLITGNPF